MCPPSVTHMTDVSAICQTAKIFTRYSTVSFTCPSLFSINNKNGQIKPNAPCNAGTKANPSCCTMGTESLPGKGELKRPRRRVNHPPHPALLLKKEHSCASTTPLSFHGKLNGEIYLYFYSFSIIVVYVFLLLYYVFLLLCLCILIVIYSYCYITQS